MGAIAWSRTGLTVSGPPIEATTFRFGSPLEKLDVLVKYADAVTVEFLVENRWGDRLQLERDAFGSKTGLVDLFEGRGGCYGVRFASLAETATISFDAYVL